MKKVIEVSIGRINFAIEDDAYFRLKNYMEQFKSTMPDLNEANEVMEDVETRVAEIFQKEMKFDNQVVNMSMVQSVINQLGEFGSKKNEQQDYSTDQSDTTKSPKGYAYGEKRLYRSSDDKMIGGVCGGLAAYLDVDSTLIRVLFVVALFTFSSGFWIYIILLIVMPKAMTIPEKLTMRGYAVTPENIRLYTNMNKR